MQTHLQELAAQPQIQIAFGHGEVRVTMINIPAQQLL
jgi:hypothetical protein